MTPFDPTATQDPRVLQRVPTLLQPPVQNPQIPVAAGAAPNPVPTPPRVLPRVQSPAQQTAEPPAPSAAVQRLQQLQATRPGVENIKNPVGRTLARIGDVILGTFSPRAEALTPGTEGNYAQRIAGAQRAVKAEQEGEENAARTALQRAQAHHAEAEAEGLENPKPSKVTNEFEKWMVDNPNGKLEDWEKFKADHAQAVKVATPFEKWMKDNPNATVADWLKLEASAKPSAVSNAFELWHSQNPNAPAEQWLKIEEQNKPGTQNEYADFKKAILDRNPGTPVDQIVKQYAAAKEAPQRPPQAMVMVPGANNTMVPTVARPGVPLPANFQTAAGVNSVNTPTAQTKTMAESAPKVLDLANRVGQLVDQQEKTLGPASSRWNEFMAGKVGAPNPDFTRLRTDVGLLQTALMRMHVGARGGEQMMEHFRDLIDTSKQSPENLRAALEEIKEYARAVQGEKGTQAEGGGAGAQGGYKVGSKYGGLTYQGGDPNKRENWK